MELKTILDDGAQFTLLMGVLATGLTLVSINNRLFDRMDRLKEKIQANTEQDEATTRADNKKTREQDKRTSRWLLAIMGLQLCIAIVLVIRIVLSTWKLTSPFLDLVIVWGFLMTLIVWAGVFVTTHRKFVDWPTVAALIGLALLPLLLKIL